MKYHSKVYLIFIVIAVVSLITVAATIHSQTKEQDENKLIIKSQQSENNDAPILDYKSEIQKPVGSDSRQKSKYFNSYDTSGKDRKIIELPTGVEPLPTISHWWLGLSALPVANSTVIVMGEISDAKANFSEDKTSLYSEFSVQVKEVFKDTGNSVGLNSVLSANRMGGSVRFASGRINKYRIDRQGMPQSGERYVLFLKQIPESGDYLILTGYKLSKGTVTPLDGEDNKDPRSALPFAQYREVEESRFLQDLRIALQTDSGDGGTKQ